MAYPNEKSSGTAGPPMVEMGSAGKSMANDEHCVPISALAMPGQDEKMMNPEVGDPVQYSIEGKVTRIEGDNAYVKPETVNGQPLDEEAAKVNDTPEDKEFGELKSMASQMDGATPARAAGGMY